MHYFTDTDIVLILIPQINLCNINLQYLIKSIWVFKRLIHKSSVFSSLIVDVLNM